MRSVEEKPYRSSPKAPFMTSTLQQEGGRKLRLGAAQVMRVAQGLYERGFITYMRTDNVALSEEALDAIRAEVDQGLRRTVSVQAPRQFTSKTKNAQEAHEAIRPTTPLRAPDQVAAELNAQELSLYRMIWQRTLASQMADATGTTLSLRLGAVAAARSCCQQDCEFAASGTTITFAGYRQVYVESVDEDAAEAEEKEALLPLLAVGQTVPVTAFTPNGHSTSPPARFTEASIVKRLEELEIGRPSTWASIIQTVQDRGYVWKKGQALVPTWTAFAVVSLLEKHFDGLVDYDFTARVEKDLDAIARNELKKDNWLHKFYFGDDTDEQLPGLKRLVVENLDEIDAAAINTFPIGHDLDGVEIVAKPGKFGPYVKRGEDTASIPEDMAPDELTVEMALTLLAQPKSDTPIGEIDGFPVFAKSGRYGPYVQWGAPDNLPPGLEKPKMASLFKTMTLERVSVADAADLLKLPRMVGVDPADGLEIMANNGRYGPYVQKGKDFRNITSEEQLLEITLAQALEIFSMPKVFKPRWTVAGRQRAATRVRRGSCQRQSRGCQGRQVRCLRHRRRNQRIAQQGRSSRRNAQRACLRAAGRTPRSDHRKGWSSGQTGHGHQEGCGQARGPGEEESSGQEGRCEKGHHQKGLVRSGEQHHAEHTGQNQSAGHDLTDGSAARAARPSTRQR